MKKKQKTGNIVDNAKQIIHQRNGIIHTAEAIEAGIHPRTLYQLRDNGELEQISRGVYRLALLESVSNPDFLVIATRIPNAVICLLSALAFHEITTQIPHEISIALPKGSKKPLIDYPPLQIHNFSDVAYQNGITEYRIDGFPIKIYDPEKTLCDCFKFRNKIGMDIVLEALKLYRIRKKPDYRKIRSYAKSCRVENVMLPYIEAIL